MSDLAILDFLHCIVLVLKTGFYQVDVFPKHYTVEYQYNEILGTSEINLL